MLDLQQRGPGFDETITSLANEKKRERRTETERYLHEIFLIDGHKGFINNVEIIFIEKTDQSDPIRG